jgi:hypothetical protein
MSRTAERRIVGIPYPPAMRLAGAPGVTHIHPRIGFPAHPCFLQKKGIPIARRSFVRLLWTNQLCHITSPGVSPRNNSKPVVTAGSTRADTVGHLRQRWPTCADLAGRAKKERLTTVVARSPPVHLPTASKGTRIQVHGRILPGTARRCSATPIHRFGPAGYRRRCV